MFYSRKEHYKNNLDFISYSRIENDLSDALHKEILVLRNRHESKLQRDNQWHFYKPLVHHSSANVNTKSNVNYTKSKNRRECHKRKPRKSSQRHHRDSYKGQIPRVEDMSLDRMKT